MHLKIEFINQKYCYILWCEICKFVHFIEIIILLYIMYIHYNPFEIINVNLTKSIWYTYSMKLVNIWYAFCSTCNLGYN